MTGNNRTCGMHEPLCVWLQVGASQNVLSAERVNGTIDNERGHRRGTTMPSAAQHGYTLLCMYYVCLPNVSS